MTETYNADRRRHRQRSAASRSLFTPLDGATYTAYSTTAALDDYRRPDISDTSTASLTSVLNHDSYATEPSPATSHPARNTPPDLADARHSDHHNTDARHTDASPLGHHNAARTSVDDISHALPNAVSTPISSSTPIASAGSTATKTSSAGASETKPGEKSSPASNTYTRDSNIYTHTRNTRPTSATDTYTAIDEDDTLHETPECGAGDNRKSLGSDGDYSDAGTILRSMDDLNISEVNRFLDDEETTKIVHRALKLQSKTSNKESKMVKIKDKDNIELTAWEKWMLVKGKIERDNKKKIYEQNQLNKYEDRKKKLLDEEKKKRIQMELRHWMNKKKTDAQVKSIEKEKEELEKETEIRKKESEKEKIEKSYKTWINNKTKLRRLQSEQQKLKEEEQSRLRMERKTACNKVYRKWKIEAKTRPSPATTPDKGVYESPCTTYFNPIPWQPIHIPPTTTTTASKTSGGNRKSKRGVSGTSRKSSRSFRPLTSRF